MSALWLVGAGRMGRAYAAVLKALDVPTLAVCRSQASADRFSAETGLATTAGGCAAALQGAGAAPTAAVVAVDVQELAATAGALIDMGCRRILLEKPGGVDAAELDALAVKADAAGAEVWLGYNRRFYGSVLATQRGLAEDGGAVSMSFDFTEASDAVTAIGYDPRVLNEWLLANSTHVIDTAFVLGGGPAEWSGLVDGALDWHPRAARFAGHGRTDQGVTFTYAADWDAPGRWAIEISSRRRRFILKPMEQLQVQQRGSFTVELQAPDDDLDQRFKPGLYRQTRAFVTGEDAHLLPSLAEHRDRLRRIYAPMLTMRGSSADV